jgi:conjugative transposon TraK protein
MFRKTNHIDTAFRHIKNFSLALVAGTLFLCGFSLWLVSKNRKDSERRVYILANGHALEAFAGDRKDNIKVEAQDHVKVFHQDFFSLDPDDKVILTNITRALYLADGSALKQYNNLRESGYYTNLISGNISQKIAIDSIRVNTNSYPYFFHCEAKEVLTRTTSILTRNLSSEGYLRNVERSENNPHGFLIERWVILENRDLKTESR